MNTYRVNAEFTNRPDCVYVVRADTAKQAEAKVVKNHRATSAKVIEQV